MLTTGKIVVKTVIKNVFGKFGIDTNMSDDDLKNIYSSVDLDGKLLIFEDLERSHIEIIKLLGYINNLVERDGVKVLLVANVISSLIPYICFYLFPKYLLNHIMK